MGNRAVRRKYHTGLIILHFFHSNLISRGLKVWLFTNHKKTPSPCCGRQCIHGVLNRKTPPQVKRDRRPAPGPWALPRGLPSSRVPGVPSRRSCAQVPADTRVVAVPAFRDRTVCLRNPSTSARGASSGVCKRGLFARRTAHLTGPLLMDTWVSSNVNIFLPQIMPPCWIAPQRGARGSQGKCINNWDTAATPHTPQNAQVGAPPRWGASPASERFRRREGPASS